MGMGVGGQTISVHFNYRKRVLCFMAKAHRGRVWKILTFVLDASASDTCFL